MKNKHGKFILLAFFFTTSLLFSNNKYCSYSIKSSKTNVLINEAFNITFYVKQKDISQVMFFDLKVQKSDKYQAILINEQRKEFSYHDAEKKFTYLIYAKKSGDFKVSFHFRVRLASDDAVAQAYVGSRDNVKPIPTIKVKISEPYIDIFVKKGKQKSDAIGEFQLSMHLNTKESNSYDAIHVLYTLKGTGYLNPNFNILNEISNSSVFEGISEVKPIATKNGFIYNKEFKYAIVAQKDFTIPAIKFIFYDHQKNIYKTISTPEENISIKPLNTMPLLDNKELPQTNIDIEYINYIYYTLFYISGLLSALLYKQRKKPAKILQKKCCFALRKSKNASEALKALLPYLTNRNIIYEIEKLENMIYKKGSTSAFKSIKADIIKKLSM